MKWLLSVAMLLQASSAYGSLIAGTPPDFVDHLPGYDAVFVGTVVAESTGTIQWALPCGRGLSPVEATRSVVLIEQVFQGTGLGAREEVLSFGPSENLIGRRVLAFGNRGCSHFWKLWGGTVELTGDSLHTSASRFFQPGHDIVVRKPYASLQKLLVPLQSRPARNSANVFSGFDKLQLVRATQRIRPANEPNTLEVKGVWLGSSSHDSVTIRFHPLWQSGSPVESGDSLLVPLSGPELPISLRFEVSAKTFAIQDGIVISFGRSLADVLALVRRQDGRGSIPPILH